MTARRAQRPAGPPDAPDEDASSAPDTAEPAPSPSPKRERGCADALSNRIIALSGKRIYRLVRGPARLALNSFHGWVLRNASLAHERSRSRTDPLHNIVIDNSESVRVPVIWVAEMFPPSYAVSMARSIRKTGWKSVWPTRSGSVQQRVEQARLTGTVNSTVLAKLMAQDQPGARLMQYTSTRLPKPYRSVEVTLVELQGSLTAVVAAFELRDDHALALDRVLRQPHEPEVKRGSRGSHSIYDRRLVAERHVAEERERMHAAARKWLASRIPGVFAIEAGGRLPVMDMIVTSQADTNVSDMRGDGNFLTALGLGQDFYLTESPELPGLFLSENLPRRRARIEDRDRFTLAGRFDSILEDDHPYFNGKPRVMRGIVAATVPEISLYLSRIAISSLLSLKARQSAAARDAAHRLHRGRSVHSIRSLRESFLRGSLDTLSIAAAVRSLASDLRSYKRNVVEFETRLNPRHLRVGESPEPPTNQLDYLASAQLEDVEKLLQEDTSTREVLGVVASLTASIEGMRTQRWGFAVSALSLLAALFAIGQALGWAVVGAALTAFITSVLEAIASALAPVAL